MPLTLKEKFDMAVKHIHNLPPSGEYQPSNNERLQFYGLFKQATDGPLKGTKRPGITSFVARAKWDAWKSKSKLSKTRAMEKYIEVFLKAARKIKDPESKRVIAQLTGNGAVSATAAAGSERVHLYGTKLSQPYRSVEWLCKLEDIPYDFHPVDLGKGEQRGEAYGKINPMRKVPCMQYQEFTIFESASILRYLADNLASSAQWYPKDPQARARVNMYLDWHHSNTRAGCAGLLFATWLLPMRGQPIDSAKAAAAEKLIKSSFKQIEQVFLANRPFLAGSHVTIADLMAYQEIIQLSVVNHAYRSSGAYPVLNVWLDRMENLAHLGEVNVVLDKVSAKAALKAKL